MTRDIRMLFVQLLGNALLIAVAIAWLRIPDARTWQVALSLLIAIVVVVAFLWLHAGLFTFYRTGAPLGAAYRTAARNLLWFAIWAAAFYFILLWIAGFADTAPQWAAYFRSKFPVGLRNLVSQPFMDRTAEAKIAIFFWFLVPALLLPFGVQLASAGLRGISQAAVLLRNGWYWISLAFAVLIGVGIPRLLIRYVPRGSLTFETTSLILRFGLAFVIAIAAWVFLARSMGRLSARGEEARG